MQLKSQGEITAKPGSMIVYIKDGGWHYYHTNVAQIRFWRPFLVFHSTPIKNMWSLHLRQTQLWRMIWVLYDLDKLQATFFPYDFASDNVYFWLV